MFDAETQAGERLAAAIFSRSDPDPGTSWKGVREELAEIADKALSAARAEGAVEERERSRKQAKHWRGLLLNVQAYGFVGEAFRALLRELRTAALAPTNVD